MSFLNNLPIQNKIILALALPLVGMLVFAAFLVQQALSKTTETAQFKHAVEVVTAAGPLVHNLQIERGMSAGFIGSKGANFSDKLPNHRQSDTSPALAEFKERFERAKKTRFTS